MKSIRDAYQSQGVVPFYQNHGAEYSNPHEQDIHKCLDLVLENWKPKIDNVLDLACGSGEITTHLKDSNVVGTDPYTQDAYFKRTGRMPLLYSFEDISKGALEGWNFDLIICSFAMHLLDPSRLPNLCYALSRLSSKMIVISPHKKPVISWNWKLKGEWYVNRVRARCYEC